MQFKESVNAFKQLAAYLRARSFDGVHRDLPGLPTFCQHLSVFDRRNSFIGKQSHPIDQCQFLHIFSLMFAEFVGKALRQKKIALS